MKKLNVLSLFSGGGGLDLGFAAAGYSIFSSTDIDDYSCKTLRLNAGKKEFFDHINITQADLTKTNSDKLLSGVKSKRKKIDVVIGGPPCQAFSVFGKRGGMNDPRGNLVWDFIRIIKEVNPTVFIFENVAGLKTIHNGTLYTNLLESLTISGEYVVSDHNYEMANYGIPQFRNRIFFIGWKKGKRIPPMIPSHGEAGSFDVHPFVTVKKALKGLPKLGIKKTLPNHIGRKHSLRIINRYENLKFGERDSITRINKLNPTRPSFTIIVGSDAGGGKGHVHPIEPREVTPRESARVQTFPDWWEFSGTGRHVIRQVGNAVPPLFAAQLAEHIKKYVFKSKKTQSYNDLLDKLELTHLK